MTPQIQALIGQAVQLLQNGLPDRAESILKKVLQIHKNSLPALEILGLIKASQGNHIDSAEYLKKAVKINPNNPATQYNLAKALTDSGEHENAIPHHQKATMLAPDNPNAWINYGVTLSKISRDEQAITQFDKALSLGINPEALFNKGISLKKLNRLEEAQEIIEFLNEQKPNHPQILLARAEIYFAKEEYEESLKILKNVCDLTPALKDAWLLRGECEYKLRLLNNALASAQKIIELDPNSPKSWSNAGAVLTELKQYQSAIEFLEKAVSINPNYVEAWNNLGLGFLELKEYDKALVSYQNAYRLNPNLPFILGSIVQIKLLTANWENIDSEIERLISDVTDQRDMVSPFSFLSICDEPSIHLINAKSWVEHTKPKGTSLPPISKEYSNKKIKLGYFSPDFKDHPVSQLLVELFEFHDRSQFEIHGFSLSKSTPGDTLRPRLKQAFDYFHEVEDKADLEITNLARDLQIDIAIDLAGHTQGSRNNIFHHRAAPIQISYLGYAGTTGLKEMDYLIADETVIPAKSQNFYTEKIIYLPNCFLTDDSERKPSSVKFNRHDFDLPDQGFIFCCFNNSYKFNRKMVKIWSEILHEVKDSVFWVPENNHLFRENLIKEFNHQGIDSNRIIFAKRVETTSDHLARFQLADLFLDASPYNAHSTAIDSIKAGIPILTLPGNSFPSLVAKSILQHITINGEMINLIAKDQSDYIRTAIMLAQDTSLCRRIRDSISNNPSFTKAKGKEFCKNIELIYQQIFIDNSK